MTPQTNPRTVFLVVGFIGAAALLFGGGAIWLISVGRAVPSEMWTLTSFALGSLGTMLASTRSVPTPSADSAPTPQTAPTPTPATWTSSETTTTTPLPQVDTR